jgi:hypothetical protein
MTSIMRVRTVWSSNVATGGGLMVQHWGGVPSLVNAQAAIDATQTALNLLTTGYATAAAWTVQGTVDVINDINGDLVDQFGGVPRTGTPSGAGIRVPGAMQVNVRLSTQTFVSGRRLTGRMFIPGLQETQRSFDAVTGVGLTQAQAVATSLAAASPGLLIWSRVHGVSAEVVTGTVITKLAVLRSRRD